MRVRRDVKHANVLLVLSKWNILCQHSVLITAEPKFTSSSCLILSNEHTKIFHFYHLKQNYRIKFVHTGTFQWTWGKKIINYKYLQTNFLCLDYVTICFSGNHTINIPMKHDGWFQGLGHWDSNIYSAPSPHQSTGLPVNPSPCIVHPPWPQHDQKRELLL